MSGRKKKTILRKRNDCWYSEKFSNKHTHTRAFIVYIVRVLLRFEIEGDGARPIIKLTKTHYCLQMRLPIVVLTKHPLYSLYTLCINQ